MEEWRDVAGFDGMYKVSSQGRVYSRHRSGRVLKNQKNPRGYHVVWLCGGGTRKLVLVHRLVATAFIPNERNLPCVNHKDEDKNNNSAENLEWCTVRENDLYGTRAQRISDARKKPIMSIDTDGNVMHYPSAEDAKDFGFIPQCIRDCIRGAKKTHRGLTWAFAGDV